MREYLESDWDKHEGNCAECPGEKDEDGYCAVCKLRALEQRFPPDFRSWVGNLTRLYQWHKAGYSLDAESLGFDEWSALALITAWYEAKTMQSMLAVSTAGEGS